MCSFDGFFINITEEQLNLNAGEDVVDTAENAAATAEGAVFVESQIIRN